MSRTHRPAGQTGTTPGQTDARSGHPGKGSAASKRYPGSSSRGASGVASDAAPSPAQTLAPPPGEVDPVSVGISTFELPAPAPQAASAPVVQRKRTVDNFQPVAADYVLKWDGFLSGVASMLTALPLQLPGPYLQWRAQPGLLAALMLDWLRASTDREGLPTAIARAMVPDNLEVVVRKSRTDTTDTRRAELRRERYPSSHLDILLPGKMDVAIAVASSLHVQLQRSLTRLARPYAAARMRRGLAELDDGLAPEMLDGYLIPQVEPSLLPASHPMDHLVAAALCHRREPLAVDGGQARAAGLVSDPALSRRAVRVEQVPGARGWYRPDAADASAEEVSLALFGRTDRAHQLIAAGPLWAVRPQLTNAHVDAELDRVRAAELADTAFGGAMRGVLLELLGAREPADPEAALLASGAADEAALAQAGPPPAGATIDREAAMAELLRCRDQLDAAVLHAEAFGVEALLVPGRARLEARISAMYEAPDEDVARWGHHAVQQGQVLADALTGLAATSAQLATVGRAASADEVRTMLEASDEPGAPDASPASALLVDELPAATREPLRGIATALVRAAAYSELIAVARGHLADARTLRARAAADALDRMLTEDLATQERLRGTGRDDMPHLEARDYWADDPDAHAIDHRPSLGEMNNRRVALRMQAAQLRAGLLAGDATAAEGVVSLAVDAKRLQLESNFTELIVRARQLTPILRKLLGKWQTVVTGDGVALTDGFFEMLSLSSEIETIYSMWYLAFSELQAAPDERRRAQWEEALDREEARFASYVAREKVYERLKRAYQLIDDVQGRIMIVDVVTLVGVTLASLALGNIAGGIAAGLRIGAVGQFVAATAVESVAYTTMDAAILGNDDVAGQLASDAATNAAQFGLLRAWGGAVRASRMGRAIEAGGASLGQRATGVALRGVEVSVNGLIVAGAQYASMQLESARKQGRFLSSDELLAAGLQGLGMAIATAILGRPLESLRGFSQETTVRARAALGLRREARKRALMVQGGADVATTREMIRADREALEAELAYYQALKSDPDARRKAQISVEDLDAIEATTIDRVHQARTTELTASLEPIGGGELRVSPDRIEAVHGEYHALGASPGPLRTGPDGRPYFTMTAADGTVTRIRAAFPPPIFGAASIAKLKNRIVGRPLSDAGAGFELIRRLNRGELVALREIGAEPPAAMPRLTEWGLGLHDGKVVLVRGDRGEVDWGHLPGVVPLAHSHPPGPGGHLRNDTVGSRRVAVSELGRVTDVPLLAREIIMPSAPDIAVMASRGVVDHRVITPFVVVRDPRTGERWIRDAGRRSGPDRLEFRIVGARPDGTMADGRSLYRALVIPEFAGERMASLDVWASSAAPGERAGNLYLERPAGAVAHGGGATTHRARSGANDAKVRAAQAAPHAQRKRALGTDPKRGYIEHEGEVGALIEKKYGWFERDATGDAEWISLSGPFEGKSFDLVGIPPGAVRYHGDDLARFLPSVDAHFLKAIDFVVLDKRNMSAAQRKTVEQHIDQKHAAQKHRLITLE